MTGARRRLLAALAFTAALVATPASEAGPSTVFTGTTLASSQYSGLHKMNSSWTGTHDIDISPLSFVYEDVGGDGFGTGDTFTLSDVTLDVTGFGCGVKCWGDRLVLDGVLTVGAPIAPGDQASPPGGGWQAGAAPTHLIGGSLAYQLEEIRSASDVRVFGDTFLFDAVQHGSNSIFNSVYFDDGVAVVYLWGAGGDETCLSPSQSNATPYGHTKCLQKEQYLLWSRGMDLAFAGQKPPAPPTAVPEPGTLALLALGLLGAGAASRRRPRAG